MCDERVHAFARARARAREIIINLTERAVGGRRRLRRTTRYSSVLPLLQSIVKLSPVPRIELDDALLAFRRLAVM